MLMRVACVLRSGGEYTAAHVERLRAGVARHLPGVGFVCLSDVPVDCERVELEHGWPGWWAKMELFRPGLGDTLYFDLDTVILGDLTGIVDAARTGDGPVIMRDVYRPTGLQSSVMWLPDKAKAEIWKAFSLGPDRWMRLHKAGGDQAFLERFWLGARRWQDICPGALASYKVDCRKGVPSETRAVVFHGKPRPWDVGWLAA
jgi:hypothetical protein